MLHLLDDPTTELEKRIREGQNRPIDATAPKTVVQQLYEAQQLNEIYLAKITKYEAEQARGKELIVAAAAKAAAPKPKTGEELAAEYKLIQEPGARAAFRRKNWKALGINEEK